MSNTTSNHSHTITASNTSLGTATGSFACPIHGWSNCNCNSLTGFSICSTCGQSYSGMHTCSGIGINTQLTMAWCGQCQQSYNVNVGHYCTANLYPNYPWPNNVVTIGTNFTWTPIQSKFKEVKEITTDEVLVYEWNGGSFDMTLPAKFTDCFLRVGYTWSPLYPLIFSAYENDSKELSFHLVTGIIDRVFNGDKIILKSVTTTKIEDNLTLIQLTERANQYLKKDEK